MGLQPRLEYSISIINPQRQHKCYEPLPSITGLSSNTLIKSVDRKSINNKPVIIVNQ